MIAVDEDDPCPRAPAAESGPATDAVVRPGPRNRLTFVIGIFASAAAASDALRNLSAGAAGTCDALLLSDAPPPGAAPQEPEAAPRLARCDLDAISRQSAEVPSPPPFEALWQSLCTTNGAKAGAEAPGTARLFRHLGQRLAEGGAAVIVRTRGPEQQLAVSRTFLEADCETLLAHEVTSPAG